MMDSSMKDGDLVFPAAQYKYFGALALISSAAGDSENAARMARKALEAAMKQRSPFDRHPAVGRLETDTAVHRKMSALLANERMDSTIQAVTAPVCARSAPDRLAGHAPRQPE